MLGQYHSLRYQNSSHVVLITQEDDGPMIHVEKRDDFVPQLLEARDVYEDFLKTSAS